MTDAEIPDRCLNFIRPTLAKPRQGISLFSLCLIYAALAVIALVCIGLMSRPRPVEQGPSSVLAPGAASFSTGAR